MVIAAQINVPAVGIVCSVQNTSSTELGRSGFKYPSWSDGWPTRGKAISMLLIYRPHNGAALHAANATTVDVSAKH